MQQDSSTVAWNQIGREWVALAQTGESRMQFLMPYTLETLGEVCGKKILDLGCGEGGYSRELAKRGAIVTAVDCSAEHIDYAMQETKRNGLDICHLVRNSNHLYEIGDSVFDLVLCSMMLMDCADLEGTVSEAARVLKPAGRILASVLHPCFNGNPSLGIGRQGEGIERQVVVKNYFSPSQWEAPLPNGTIPVVWHHRTLEEYVHTFVKSGLTIIGLLEPFPTQEQAKGSTMLAWLQKVPLFLFWDLKKQEKKTYDGKDGNHESGF